MCPIPNLIADLNVLSNYTSFDIWINLCSIQKIIIHCSNQIFKVFCSSVPNENSKFVVSKIDIERTGDNGKFPEQ